MMTLSLAPSRTLIRKLGGFFIRRKMEETEDGKKDVLYRSLLHAVSLFILKAMFTKYSFLIMCYYVAAGHLGFS